MDKALYRKYRSRSLDEIVGQDHITDSLKQAIKSKKLAHAYLFTGPRGTGKTSIARILAHAINDFPYELEDHYLDIIEIDAASNTGVDNIRELREKAIIAPSQGEYKVYIIDEVHMLSKSAFNALLKILEEPPKHVIFILATTDPEKIPITILSRTQKYAFRLCDNPTMQNHLKSISDKENIQITDDALELITRRGGGSFRDAISLLDQFSTLSDAEITVELIENSLGLPSGDLVKSILTAYAVADKTSLEQYFQDIVRLSIKPEIIAKEIIETIITTPNSQTIPLITPLTTVLSSPHPSSTLLLALIGHLPSDNKNSSPSQGLRETPKPSVTSDHTTTNTTERPKSKENKKSPTTDFSYDTFLAELKKSSPLLATRLAKLNYKTENHSLIIDAPKKLDQSLLQKPENIQKIQNLLPKDWIFNISTVENPQKSPKPKTAEDKNPLSAIMGDIEEVEIDGEIS